MMELNVRIDNLELSNDLCISKHGISSELIIARWVEREDGYSLFFIGDRPLDKNVNWLVFGKLVELGQMLADYKFSLE